MKHLYRCLAEYDWGYSSRTVFDHVTVGAGDKGRIESKYTDTNFESFAITLLEQNRERNVAAR